MTENISIFGISGKRNQYV